jgi:hypothetical protein
MLTGQRLSVFSEYYKRKYTLEFKSSPDTWMGKLSKSLACRPCALFVQVALPRS